MPDDAHQRASTEGTGRGWTSEMQHLFQNPDGPASERNCRTAMFVSTRTRPRSRCRKDEGKARSRGRVTVVRGGSHAIRNVVEGIIPGTTTRLRAIRCSRPRLRTPSRKATPLTAIAGGRTEIRGTSPGAGWEKKNTASIRGYERVRGSTRRRKGDFVEAVVETPWRPRSAEAGSTVLPTPENTK